MINPQWQEVKTRLKSAKNIIDLGCGTKPIQGAKTAVDFSIEPKQRRSGFGDPIDTKRFFDLGIRFVNARIDGPLPFDDHQFDFAYSHHVFEHLEDPGKACQEMMRIATCGVIITPSFFAEQIFGRPYHRWLVMDRGKKIFFFAKRPFEQTPFGHPSNTNPFDMLLNDGGWYQGQEGNFPKLSKILQEHWYGHSPLLEVIFIWDHEFQWQVIE
jgi:SAM-dependent methyltransferase